MVDRSATGIQAWTATSLDRKQWSTTLDPDAAHRLSAAATAQRDRPFDQIDDADVRSDLAGITADCREFLYGVDGTGFAVVRGIPTDGVDEDVVERIYWLLGLQLGEPVTQSRALDVIGHVRRELGASPHRGYKSSAYVGFHSDMTATAGLLCRNQAPSGGDSTLVSSMQIYNVMLAERPDLVEILFHDFPVSRIDEHNPDEPPYVMQPIFAEKDGRIGCHYGRKLIIHALKVGAPPLTPEQTEALDCFDEIAARPGMTFSFLLQPGELFWMNNYSVLHGRSDFTDDVDPARRRHLLRLWLDVPDHELEPLPRAMRYDFRYGNIGKTAGQAAAYA